MPITITPGPGSTLGPGFQIQVSSNITPAPPAGSQWWVYQQSADELHSWLYSVCQWVGPLPTRIAIGFSDVGNDVFIPTLEGWEIAGNTRLLVELRDNTNTVLENLSQQVTWDQTTGTPALLKTQIEQSSTQGAFTTEDRAQAVITQQAVAFGIGGGLGEAVEQLLAAVGRRLFGRELIGDFAAGDYQLSRPGGPYGVNAWAVAWQIIAWPPGLGFDEGSVDRTEISYGQISQLQELADATFSERDSRYMDGVVGVWEWGWAAPDAIAVYVLPGVTVRLWWVVIFGSAAAARLVTPNAH